MIAPFQCLEKQAGKRTQPKERQQHNGQKTPKEEQGDEYGQDQDESETRPFGLVTIRDPAAGQGYGEREVEKI